MATAQPVTPVPAATILMLRPGPSGMEVFMVERHHQIDFVAGALVFPGGRVDPQDSAPGVLFDQYCAARAMVQGIVGHS